MMPCRVCSPKANLPPPPTVRVTHDRACAAQCLVLVALSNLWMDAPTTVLHPDYDAEEHENDACRFMTNGEAGGDGPEDEPMYVWEGAKDWTDLFGVSSYLHRQMNFYQFNIFGDGEQDPDAIRGEIYDRRTAELGLNHYIAGDGGGSTVGRSIAYCKFALPACGRPETIGEIIEPPSVAYNIPASFYEGGGWYEWQPLHLNQPVTSKMPEQIVHARNMDDWSVATNPTWEGGCKYILCVYNTPGWVPIEFDDEQLEALKGSPAEGLFVYYQHETETNDDGELVRTFKRPMGWPGHDLFEQEDRAGHFCLPDDFNPLEGFDGERNPKCLEEEDAE